MRLKPNNIPLFKEKKPYKAELGLTSCPITEAMGIMDIKPRKKVMVQLRDKHYNPIDKFLKVTEGSAMHKLLLEAIEKGYEIHLDGEIIISQKDLDN